MTMRNLKYTIFLTLLYFALSLVGILHHELWLDEAQHFLLARDSTSLVDLVAKTRFEGHPIIWNVLLYGITRFSSNPFGMQLLHILISTATVAVFLKKGPFSWIFKSVFIFGYFIIYEYNLISRNYILGLLFLFLALSYFKQRHKKMIPICIYLALATNVHLIFSVIAFAVFLVLLLEEYSDRNFSGKQLSIGVAIFAVGIVFLIAQIASTHYGWFFNEIRDIPLTEKFTKGFISLFKGLVTVPDFSSIHFWNSNLLVNLSKPVSAILGTFFYGLPLLLFCKNRKTLFFFYIGVIGVQFFFFITQRGATRFDGMVYILFIIALWIEKYYPSEDYRLKTYLETLKLPLLKKSVVYCILTLQLFSGIFAYATDMRHPFTGAKATVAYLKEKGIANPDIIAVTCDGTLLSAYLEAKIYFLCNQDYQGYCRWGEGCGNTISEPEIIGMLTNYMKGRTHAFYVSGYPIGERRIGKWQKVNEKIQLRLLKEFERNIMANSAYYVFEISAINSPSL
jgi:hypothetical protein